MTYRSKSQKNKVIAQLREHGSVSRNWALGIFVSRLGAIVNQLNKEGWKLEGRYVREEHGKDFIYEVVKEPERLVVKEYINEDTGEHTFRHEKATDTPPK